MRVEEIDSLFRRMDRLSMSLKVTGGSGLEWDATDSDGQTHSYRIKGVRPVEEIEDDVTHLFLWVWNLKDYLKELAISQGRSAQFIEQLVKQDPHLPICADIANGLKHGVLKTTRSGRSPRLQQAGYNISGEAIGRITIGVLEVELDVTNPDHIEIVMGVEDDSGQYIGDAFGFLRGAIATWETVFGQLKGSCGIVVQSEGGLGSIE